MATPILLLRGQQLSDTESITITASPSPPVGTTSPVPTDNLSTTDAVMLGAILGEHTDKLNLEEGETYDVYTTKPELDANAIRAELEGSPVEDRGDDIYVSKAELEGTLGTERSKGVRPMKKSELEAASKTRTAAAQQNSTELQVVAELEAVSRPHTSMSGETSAELEAVSPKERDRTSVLTI
ncbi:hypothetical protein GGR55DRAFT_699978 [Xylaria sp. FL0064]|nr:hypothetical protein GGR55DRAFT_699978 [Xylaria sp. FL0064]